MKILAAVILIFALILSGCVSRPPSLTSTQLEKLSKVIIYKDGETPNKEYKLLNEISAADCSGAPGGRVWGDADKAIENLRQKAVAINADAVIKVSCGAVPFLNNCWAAQKCTGDAVIFQQ